MKDRRKELTEEQEIEERMEAIRKDPLAHLDVDQTEVFLHPRFYRPMLVTGSIPIPDRAEAMKLYGHPRVRLSEADKTELHAAQTTGSFGTDIG